MKLKPPYKPQIKQEVLNGINLMVEKNTSITGEIERMKGMYKSGKKTILPSNYKYQNWDIDF